MRFLTDDSKGHPAGTGPKVIAAGLPRCATSSLQAAFEDHLGYAPCMHFAHIAPYADRLRLVRSIALEKDKATRQAKLHTIFDNFDSSADFPGCWFLEDLLEMYPDCKVILNKRRDGRQWYKSFMDTLEWFTRPNGAYAWLCWLVETDRENARLQATFKAQVPGKFGVQDWSPELFDAHCASVRDLAERNGKTVLEWEPQDGWGPICKFLNKEVPKTPFPKVNETAQILFLQKVFIARGAVYWMAAMVAPVAVCYAVQRFIF